ncbi:hypothetical protein DRQ25_17220 [Candidatus Fermentibacteria bacterium]|nr:MAG: hypothetical protein DRQ25_17220 [Candidatus Fermentibacteria bacterium]
MTNWITTPKLMPERIIEVENSKSDRTIVDIYKERYSQPLNPQHYENIQRYIDEIFLELKEGSSLLIVGSGHPENAKTIKEKCPNLGKVGCVDRIKEASIGLIDYGINFYQLDVLVNGLPIDYDYIFSSHTLEHFTRSELLHKVLPRMREAAHRTVYAVVPYEEAWAEEPTHRCKFYRGDELFCASRKYKIIHKNQELVLNF